MHIQRRTAVLAVFAVTAWASLAAAQVPERPTTPAPGSQTAQPAASPALQQGGLGEQIRQRIQQSGLTPDQVRARLRSAGYPESIADAYLGPTTPGRAAPAPNAEVLRAMSALGFSDLALADTLRLDSLLLSREDSLYLDSLGFVVGADSIPARRDSLGVMRLDTAAVLRLAERLRRPRLFGLDVFRRPTTQFAPVQNAPVDPDYRLGPGDELALILTGEVELAYSLTVTREGSLLIPLAGQVSVANLTMDQLRELLFTRLGRVYASVQRGPSARTRFDVTLTRVRTLQVFVNGEVLRPGAYAISAVGTVMHALYQAGGPTERGNFRRVQVLRAGQPVGTLDLYAYLLRGDTRNDLRLGQGDVIFVPPRERRIAVLGSVLRPGLYDLAPDEGLREAIAMAGGLLPEADVSRALIERILPPEQRGPDGRVRTVISADLRQALGDRATVAYRLEADDRITVFAAAQPARNQVVLKGNVWRPGIYEVTEGMTLAALVAQAGGPKPDTYLDLVHILRLDPDSTRRFVPASLSGAVGDPLLAPSDEVTVYSMTSFRPQRQVAVFGSVLRPGLHAFRDSMTLRDAVVLAGGLRDEAYLLEAEISRLPADRTNGRLAEILRVPLDSAFVLDQTGYLVRPTGERSTNPRLQPYDNIFIRRLPGWELQRNVVISGEVRFPGRYTLTRRDERLSDLIQRAGGLTDAAYVRGAQFYRAESRAGRVGIELDRVLRDAGHRDNLILLTGDSVHVPQYQPVVIVEGSVNSPVAVAFVPDRNAGFYVDRAGGYARRADEKRTYIVQPNGAVQRRGERVEPGARVFVPERPPDEARTNWAAVVTASMATLASLLSILVLAKQL